eukprot:2630888-Amphidinium_carterae.1
MTCSARGHNNKAYYSRVVHAQAARASIRSNFLLPPRRHTKPSHVEIRLFSKKDQEQHGPTSAQLRPVSPPRCKGGCCVEVAIAQRRLGTVDKFPKAQTKTVTNSLGGAIRIKQKRPNCVDREWLLSDRSCAKKPANPVQRLLEHG